MCAKQWKWTRSEALQSEAKRESSDENKYAFLACTAEWYPTADQIWNESMKMLENAQKQSSEW